MKEQSRLAIVVRVIFLYFLRLIYLLHLDLLQENLMIRVLRETHDTPEEVARRLEAAGGRNRFGEANYRVIWGWNRLAWIGGKFEDRDAHGDLLREVVELRLEPK